MGCTSSKAVVEKSKSSPTAVKAPGTTELASPNTATRERPTLNPDDIAVSTGSGGMESGTPRIGKLTPSSGRRLSVRDAPALPLSPKSRLREGSVFGPAAIGVPQTSWLPLHIFAEDGDMTGLRSAVENYKARVDTKTQDEVGYTALWLAAQAGKTAVVKYLLAHGAAVDLQNSRGESPLYIASMRGKAEAVKALISAGANVDLKALDNSTPLYAAVASGQPETTSILLESTAGLKVRTKDGCGLLCAAARSGVDDVLESLLVFKASLNLEERDANGHTPLYLASKEGHVGVVKQLLHKGAMTDAAAGDGTTPLWAASFYGHEVVVRMLLEKGASLACVSRKGAVGDHFAEGVTDEEKAEIEQHLKRAKNFSTR